MLIVTFKILTCKILHTFEVVYVLATTYYTNLIIVFFVYLYIINGSTTIIFYLRQIRIKRFYILYTNIKRTRFVHFKSFCLSMLDLCRHSILLLSIDVAHFWWTRNLRWKRFKVGYLRLLLTAYVLTINFHFKMCKVVRSDNESVVISMLTNIRHWQYTLFYL